MSSEVPLDNEETTNSDKKKDEKEKLEKPINFVPAIIASIVTLPCICGLFALVLVCLGKMSASKGERHTAKYHLSVAYIFSFAGVLVFIFVLTCSELKISVKT